jgi:hypothetical protein
MVLFDARFNSGLMKENVHHSQRYTASSGLEYFALGMEGESCTCGTGRRGRRGKKPATRRKAEEKSRDKKCGIRNNVRG